MISLPTNTDIFLFSQPTEMRMSFYQLDSILPWRDLNLRHDS